MTVENVIEMPASSVLLIRVGTRESAQAKALRLLVEGRVAIRSVHMDEAVIHAYVRGDSGRTRFVRYHVGRWSCPCPARGDCSHIKAVQLVTEVQP